MSAIELYALSCIVLAAFICGVIMGEADSEHIRAVAHLFALPAGVMFFPAMPLSFVVIFLFGRFVRLLRWMSTWEAHPDPKLPTIDVKRF
jgi:hypothetical protein